MTNQVKVQCPHELKYLQPVLIRNLDRFGNATDGGYALTRDVVSQSSHFLSLGLGENWSFESAVRDLNSTSPIDIYDHTVSQNFFIKKALKGIVKFVLFRDSFSNLQSRFIRLYQYIEFWNRPSLNRHHRVRITRDTFKEILSDYPVASQIGLKVDIEGSEWEILELIAEAKDKIAFILIEIHNFDRHEFELRNFLTVIKDSFEISHLHANNFEPVGHNGFPKVFEITLLKRHESTVWTEYRQQLPVEDLDVPNSKNRPDFQISFG